MLRIHLPVYTSQDIIPQLLNYCAEQDLRQFLIVADENTYAALGEKVEAALIEQGLDVKLALLAGAEVIADENHLLQVFIQADREARTYLAIGTGTITDITRFASHRTKSTFLSLPTAPSVDGFTSTGAPLVVGGLKKTYACQPPSAVFTDLPTLCAAPHRLISAGFGDLIGKILAAADWELGHLLWNEPFDQSIKERARQAAFHCAVEAEEIGKRSPESIRHLMEGLLETGFCMLDFGNSAPASGAEHHMSHFWEMKLLREKRPALLHGAKVGVATVITAGWYEAIRGLSRAEVAARLREAKLPDRASLIKEIRDQYGPVAESIIAEQSSFTNLDEAGFSQLKERILTRWEAVQAIAQEVPPPKQIAAWLRAAGAPACAHELGLSDAEVRLAEEYGHFLRNRFTIGKLRRILGTAIPSIEAENEIR